MLGVIELSIRHVEGFVVFWVEILLSEVVGLNGSYSHTFDRCHQCVDADIAVDDIGGSNLDFAGVSPSAESLSLGNGQVGCGIRHFANGVAFKYFLRTEHFAVLVFIGNRNFLYIGSLSLEEWQILNVVERQCRRFTIVDVGDHLCVVLVIAVAGLVAQCCQGLACAVGNREGFVGILASANREFYSAIDRYGNRGTAVTVLIGVEGAVKANS